MEFEQLKDYLLAKPETTLGYPFGEDTHVFKVNNKMFALFGRHNDLPMLNVKCDPLEAAALCDIHQSITPGYHMDKRHWISVYFDGSVPQSEVERLIDNSFNLVVTKMPKREQARLFAD